MLRPRSLVRIDDAPPALFTRDVTLDLARQVQALMVADADVISISSWLLSRTDFSLGEVTGGYDSAERTVSFEEAFGQRLVDMSTDQIDPAALKDAVTRAEALARALVLTGAKAEPRDPLRPASPSNPALWSENTLSLTAPEARLGPVEVVLAETAKIGLVGAGSLILGPLTRSVWTDAGHFEYGRASTATFSVTARQKDSTGSGWASWVGEDWSQADPVAIAARAADVAERSRNPVAVEPGRWTVVMTPEACGALVQWIAFLRGEGQHILGGQDADRGRTPFSKPGGGNLIGLKVMDERVTLSADPMDPIGGFMSFELIGDLLQYRPVTWVDHGILRTLSYPRRAAAERHGLEQVNNPGSLRMSGGPTSIDEMIATTDRGIYVTRFSDVTVTQVKSLQLTGVTRDGTFLIEKGKITKPVKNMRFEDSPMSFLNNIEALGPVKRVPTDFPSVSYVMPAIKVRDFAFTSLTDAI